MKDTGIRLTLVNANEWTSAEGRRYRREQWSISGGEIDPAWNREAGSEPSSSFSLYVVDDEVNVRLASYGGAVWPTAWPTLFEGNRHPGARAFVEITDLGLSFRAAALCGGSDMYADVRLS